jgi:hypothetical protein
MILSLPDDGSGAVILCCCNELIAMARQCCIWMTIPSIVPIHSQKIFPERGGVIVDILKIKWVEVTVL